MNESSPLIRSITPKACTDSSVEPSEIASSSAPAICVSVRRRKPPPFTTPASIAMPMPLGVAKPGRCRSRMPRLPLPSVVRRSGCVIPKPSIVAVTGPSETTTVPAAVSRNSEPDTPTVVLRLCTSTPGRRTVSGHFALSPTPPSKCRPAASTLNSSLPRSTMPEAGRKIPSRSPAADFGIVISKPRRRSSRPRRPGSPRPGTPAAAGSGGCRRRPRTGTTAASSRPSVSFGVLPPRALTAP